MTALKFLKPILKGWFFLALGLKAEQVLGGGYTAPSEADHHQQTKMADFTLKTIEVLGIKHAVIMTTATEDVNDLIGELWSRGTSAEVHFLPHFTHDGNNTASSTTQDDEGSKTCRALASRVVMRSMRWDFLYWRDLVPRSNMAVLLVGPADWVVPVAVQMMSRNFFGAMDTLLILSRGQVSSSDLCPCIPIGVRVAVLQYEGRNKACEGFLKEAKLMEGGSYTLKSVGCWHKGDLILRKPLLPLITSLKGAKLRTVTVKGFTEILPVRRGKDLHLEGTLASFITDFMERLNFSLEVREVVGFGTKTDNGSFSGVVGFLERWEADFGSASLSVLPERAQVIDYGAWFGLHNTRFITKVPFVLQDHFLLFRIYTSPVWCVILGVLIITGLVLYLTWGKAENGGRGDRSVTLFFTVLSVTFKTAVLKSSSREPRRVAGKIVFIAIWFTMFILVAVYSGNLTAFLAMPRVSKPPETMSELLEKGYTLSISRGFSQYSKMEASPIESHQRAFRSAEFRQDQGILPNSSYVQRVRTKAFALLVTVMGVAKVIDVHAEKVGSVKVCTLKSASEPLFLEMGALGFPRNSPVKRLFDHITVWMRNTGLKSEPGSTCLKPNLQQGRKPIAILQVSGVLALWAIGTALGILVFVLEILVFRF